MLRVHTVKETERRWVLVRIGVKPGQYGWSFAELVESWIAAEEAGFDVLGCFDHVSSSPNGERAWDAPTLLAAMAGRTQRIPLGVYVLNASLRHPFLVSSQLAVVQAASGGRLEVAVGLGSHYFARHDHQALGIPFPGFAERAARLETYCRILPALWRGESITDQALGLKAASLGPIGIVPPAILVGGKSGRCLDIAVRYADGWHAPSMEPAEFASIVRRLDRGSDHAGRPPLTKSVQVRPSNAGDLKEHVDRFADAGASTVVFVLDPERGADAVRRLADRVL